MRASERYISAVVFATVLGAGSIVARADDGQHCVLPYVKILARDGFTGLTDCSQGTVDAHRVGEVVASGKHYAIIDYRYVTKPMVAGGVSHGGQRILVIESGENFRGGYVLGTPPFYTISIHGKSVYIDAPQSQGNEIRFGDSGPPERVHLAGDLTRLSR